MNKTATINKNCYFCYSCKKKLYTDNNHEFFDEINKPFKATWCKGRHIKPRFLCGDHAIIIDFDEHPTPCCKDCAGRYGYKK